MKIATLCLVVMKIFRDGKMVFCKQSGDGMLECPALKVVVKIGFYSIAHLYYRTAFYLWHGALHDIPVFIFLLRYQVFSAQFHILNFTPAFIIGGRLELRNFLLIAKRVINGYFNVGPIKSVVIEDFYSVMPFKKHLKTFVFAAAFTGTNNGGGILKVGSSKIKNKIRMSRRIYWAHGGFYFLLRNFPKF